MAGEGYRLEVNICRRLKQFDLDVRFTAGNGVLGILGPSGCGKSMTLKSIAGIAVPDSGQITLTVGENRQIFYDSRQKIFVRPQKRRVGYLFQDYALFPNMTVAQNIAAGLGKGRDHRETVARMAKRFRLEGLEHRYPQTLSGGQQQRAALARIFAYGPQVLLLDEPFSAMDAFLRERLRLEMADMLKEYDGISILVTHDRDEAYQLCEHLLLLDEGRVLAAGPTKEVFANPRTVQAARLTGCKNISRIERLGDHRVRALDWDGLELLTEGFVGREVTHIGIRAHDLRPAGGEYGKDVVNRIPVRNPDITEMPFEWYLTLANGLWWKKEKTIHVHDSSHVVPEYLYVLPEAVLLLETTDRQLT